MWGILCLGPLTLNLTYICAWHTAVLLSEALALGLESEARCLEEDLAGRQGVLGSALLQAATLADASSFERLLLQVRPSGGELQVTRG